ncbi:hypothetical protein UJ101_00610 [Flavobacteriaceae bacterium UJ101]|nr:hypothetical protein UJ101_00610 [Flavobacteriaceae bacterium UJ101]
MKNSIELNQGEIKIIFKELPKGKKSFKELGFQDHDLFFEGGNVRIVFDFSPIPPQLSFFKTPTIELFYNEQMEETHWVCDFNRKTILDKKNHHGHSTILLLNRNKLNELEQRHQNILILHADFPSPVQLISSKSSFHF